jgi:hypothetical protein
VLYRGSKPRGKGTIMAKGGMRDSWSRSCAWALERRSTAAEGAAGCCAVLCCAVQAADVAAGEGRPAGGAAGRQQRGGGGGSGARWRVPLPAPAQHPVCAAERHLGWLAPR